MKPEIKAKWLAALRSGEYRQGKDMLRNERNEFCCLGVLCDIHAKETVTEAWRGSDDCAAEYPYEYLGSDIHLPKQVQEWAGLNDKNPHVPYGPNSKALSDLNDENKSFEFIANLIEEHL